MNMIGSTRIASFLSRALLTLSQSHLMALASRYSVNPDRLNVKDASCIVDPNNTGDLDKILKDFDPREDKICHLLYSEVTGKPFD